MLLEKLLGRRGSVMVCRIFRFITGFFSASKQSSLDEIDKELVCASEIAIGTSTVRTHMGQCYLSVNQRHRYEFLYLFRRNVSDRFHCLPLMNTFFSTNIY